jgi:hypothetical protein
MACIRMHNDMERLPGILPQFTGKVVKFVNLSVQIKRSRRRRSKMMYKCVSLFLCSLPGGFISRLHQQVLLWVQTKYSSKQGRLRMLKEWWKRLGTMFFCSQHNYCPISIMIACRVESLRLNRFTIPLQKSQIGLSSRVRYFFV